MARNEHKKVLQQLSEAYGRVYEEGILDKIRGKKAAGVAPQEAPPQEAPPQEAAPTSMGASMAAKQAEREAEQGKEGGARWESSPHLYQKPGDVGTAEWNTPGTEDHEIAQEYFGTHPESAEDIQGGYRPPLKGQEDRFQPGGDLHGNDPTVIGQTIETARQQNAKYKDVPGKENLVRPGMEEEVVSRDVIEGHDKASESIGGGAKGHEYQMKNNPEYAAAQARMADSPHKRGSTQIKRESTMRAKDELQQLSEAYGRVYENAEEPRHLSALKRMQRDIMNGMTAKESMEGMMIHPSHMRDLLEEYLEWAEGSSEGPIETGFEDDPESSYDIEKRLGGGRFDHPGKTYRSGSPRVRLTRDSPGTSSVHLPEGDPRIQKYIDKGYKIVKDYKKAEQSEDES